MTEETATPFGANIPARIGRYEILGRLATGGMAEILLGRVQGPSGFERPVVVKRILPHLARLQSFVDMFLDEARIAAGIGHRNVIQVHELARDGEDLYLVMEYLEGESAAGVLRRSLQRSEPIPPEVAAFIVAEACAGLHAAHELRDHEGRELGVVHRDVSPHNLFITYDGGVKVLDFGIAKAADRVTVTETGTFKGKFRYMSPEQIESAPLDRRHDVFALGIVLFELITGRALFRRDTQLQSMQAITRGEVPPPSSLVDDCPAELERICLKALASSRDERYPTAAEMRRDLVGFLSAQQRTALPEEVLSSLMDALFAERREQKRAMLASARRGSRLENVPSAEADVEVELPEATPGRATPEAVRSVDPRVRWSVWAAGLAVAIAVATAAWAVSRTASPGEPAAATVPSQAPSDAPQVATAPPAPPPEAPPAEPALVRVRIETTPSGADVWRGEEALGVTPLDLSLPRSDEPVELVLRRDRYRPERREVVPSRDQLLHLELLRQPRVARPRRRPPEAPPPEEQSPSGFRRFD